MKMSCEVVQDLLPLYLDEICSQDSREAVEAHLRTCESCEHQLLLLREAYADPHARPEEAQAVRAASAAWNKDKYRSFFKGVAIVLTVILVINILFVLPYSKFVITATARVNQERITVFSQKALAEGEKQQQKHGVYRVTIYPDSGCVFFENTGDFQYTGFFYSATGAPVGCHGQEMDLTQDGGQWFWAEPDGNNWYVAEHITGNLYWYEMHY